MFVACTFVEAYCHWSCCWYSVRIHWVQLSFRCHSCSILALRSSIWS